MVAGNYPSQKLVVRPGSHDGAQSTRERTARAVRDRLLQAEMPRYFGLRILLPECRRVCPRLGRRTRGAQASEKRRRCVEDDGYVRERTKRRSQTALLTHGVSARWETFARNRANPISIRNTPRTIFYEYHD